MTEQGITVLNWKTVGLAWTQGRDFFTIGVLRLATSCKRCGFPIPKMFKARLNGALSSLVLVKCSLSMSGVVGPDDLQRSPSTQTILWFHNYMNQFLIAECCEIYAESSCNLCLCGDIKSLFLVLHWWTAEFLSEWLTTIMQKHGHRVSFSWILIYHSFCLMSFYRCMDSWSGK